MHLLRKIALFGDISRDFKCRFNSDTESLKIHFLVKRCENQSIFWYSDQKSSPICILRGICDFRKMMCHYAFFYDFRYCSYAFFTLPIYRDTRVAVDQNRCCISSDLLKRSVKSMTLQNKVTWLLYFVDSCDVSHLICHFRVTFGCKVNDFAGISHL